MSTEPQTAHETMLEKLVMQVRGVMAARIVKDAHGQIDEIHVIASAGRSAKQMVRDIESIVYVRGGVRIDHRKISLVQLAEQMQHPNTMRVRLLDIERSVDEQGLSLTVTLMMGEQRVKGVGRCRPGYDDQAEHLAAHATIHALNQLITPRGQLHLVKIQRQMFGDIEVYLSYLTLTADDGVTTLLGISELRDRDVVVVVRAVLDAANRPLQRLIDPARWFGLL